MKKLLSALLAVLFVVSLCSALVSCGMPESGGTRIEPGFVTVDPAPNGDDDPFAAAEPPTPDDTADPGTVPLSVEEDGEYDDRNHVALYIATYGRLPKNYITKKEAEALGWTGGSLDTVAKGRAIGGSYFGNYEGSLPTADGRKYYECDIDTIGQKSRGAKRIVYSNDGLIYYTDDHYETFTLLYGEE